MLLVKLNPATFNRYGERSSRGSTAPLPQPEDHNRDLDPGFEEVPDIFVDFKDGVFYQTSYDSTEVAIIADYPGLLPSSHVST